MLDLTRRQPPLARADSCAILIAQSMDEMKLDRTDLRSNEFN